MRCNDPVGYHFPFFFPPLSFVVEQEKVAVRHVRHPWLKCQRAALFFSSFLKGAVCNTDIPAFFYIFQQQKKVLSTELKIKHGKTEMMPKMSLYVFNDVCSAKKCI